MEGWIKIYRKITESPMYFSEKFNRMLAWIDLIMLANFDDAYIYIRGQKVIVKRGQVSASKDFLAKRWGWSKWKVLKYLDELQEDGMIELQNSRLIGLISIVNYERYQETELQTEPQTSKAIEPQIEPQTTPQNNLANDYVSNTYNGNIANTEPQIAPQAELQIEPQIAPPNKNVKNIYITQYSARTRDYDDFISQFFSLENQPKIEKLCMDLHTDGTTLRSIAQSIANEWTLSQLSHKDYSDASQHLINLLRIKINARNKNDSTGVSTVQQRQQQAADIISRLRAKQH